MVAKRGIMFEFETSIAPSANKAFDAFEKRIDAIQKRMQLSLSVTERGARGTSGSNGSGGATSSPDAAAKAAERAAQARERAAEKAFRAEARLNRMAEAAVEKRERTEARAAERAERDAKRAADAQVREAKRAEAEKQKELSAAARRQKSDALREQRADKAFWSDFEKFGEDRAKAKADAEKKSAAEQRKAERERQQAEREAELAARRQAEAQNRVREGIYGTVHAFGQLTRAAAQFGLIGQRDMAKVLDTIFAVEGGINALQGAMGAVRAVRGIRNAGAVAGAAGAAGNLAGAAGGAGGLGGAAGIGAAGLPAAGILALAAGGIGAAGAIADRRRGVAGNVGGFWDTIGTKGSGIGASASGLLLRSAAGLDAAFNSPFGLTSRERELRKEQYLEKQVGLDFIPGARTALSDIRTERMGRFTAEEIGNRARQRDLRNRIDAEILPLEIEQRAARNQLGEQRHGLRMAGIGARGQNIAGQLGAAFGRQQGAYGELAALQARQAAGEFVDPAQLARAAAEQAREEGRVTSLAERQRNNLLTAQARAGARGREIGQELTGARQRLAGATSEEGKQQFSREVLDAEERLKKNEEERLQIAERIRQVGVEGAQRELALREQSLATAKQTADSLRGQRESAVERFGNLNPMQRRATLEAARMFKQGTELQEPQLDLLRNLPEFFGPQLRERAQRKFKEEGGEELERLSGFQGRLGEAEAREKQAIALDVNARNEIAIRLDANTDAMARALEERITPIFKSIMQAAVSALEERLHMAQGQDFSQATERANAAGGP